MSKLIAILHDGTLDGDNSFYVTLDVSADNVIEYNGQSMKELVQIWLDRMTGEDGEVEVNEGQTVEEALEEYGYEKPIGAWILDEKAQDVIDIVTNVDCGNDSSTYMVNRIAKQICNKMAVKKLGKKVVECNW